VSLSEASAYWSQYRFLSLFDRLLAFFDEEGLSEANSTYV